MWMSWNDLDHVKLSQHTLRQITDHARFVSEPDLIGVDILKRVCLAMLCVHVKDTISSYDQM